MDVTKILADLRQEREQIEEAILSLERLARGRLVLRGDRGAHALHERAHGTRDGARGNELHSGTTR